MSESPPRRGDDASEPDSTGATPNDRVLYSVRRADLPLHCPLPGMTLWNSHPRVFLPIETSGRAKCPYCGAEFTLGD
jgi:uncharacterized Zn-finger protein